MRRIHLVLAVAAAIALTMVDPVGAEPRRPAAEGASGGFQLTVHTHSTNPATLLEPDVERLQFDFEEGDTFTYSSRQCDETARFNDLGSTSGPTIPASTTTTAPLRPVTW